MRRNTYFAFIRERGLFSGRASMPSARQSIPGREPLKEAPFSNESVVFILNRKSQNLHWRNLFLIFSFFLPVCFADFSEPAANKASEPFKVEEMAQGLGVVWGMVFLNDREILFTEREGQFKKLNLKTKRIQSLSGAPEVYARGQGGLMDVALHPHFQKNKKVYFSYSKRKKRKQTMAVAVGILKRKQLIQVKDIFEAQPIVSSSIHFGSRLVFDKQGFLFVTVGDRGKRHSAQNLKTHLGKILRLTDRGAPPPDNPFVSVKEAQPEIWSLGHRNPQGIFIHPETGELWEQEHGPRGGDEINQIQKGQNYGWPVITFGREYWGPSIGEGRVKKGMKQPVKHFTPSIAPSSLLIYSGKVFKKWKGDFFSGALVLTHLNRLKIIKGKVEERLLSQLKLRVREVIEGPDGLIYLSTDEGKILRLIPL